MKILICSSDEKARRRVHDSLYSAPRGELAVRVRVLSTTETRIFYSRNTVFGQFRRDLKPMRSAYIYTLKRSSSSNPLGRGKKNSKGDGARRD
uniref:Uncharacterized protein n=1 Tax=Trichogramma kaykai TaxID=54128 RepID=A0ABD2VXW2_9HYME